MATTTTEGIAPGSPSRSAVPQIVSPTAATPPAALSSASDGSGSG
jgi:hypothetical protein